MFDIHRGPVVGPGANLERAQLLVKWEELHVDGAETLVDSWRLPDDKSVVMYRRFGHQFNSEVTVSANTIFKIISSVNIRRCCQLNVKAFNISYICSILVRRVNIYRMPRPYSVIRWFCIQIIYHTLPSQCPTLSFQFLERTGLYFTFISGVRVSQ